MVNCCYCCGVDFDDGGCECTCCGSRGGGEIRIMIVIHIKVHASTLKTFLNEIFNETLKLRYKLSSR